MRLARWIGAAVLALHGLVHLVGVVDLWRLAEPEGGFRTTFLDGRWEPAEPVLYLAGALWLVAGAAFVAAAYALVRRRSWLVPWTAAAATASLVLSLAAWPEAQIGVLVNLALLAALLLLRARPGARTLTPAR